MAFERDDARKLVGGEHFFEVFCDAPLAACEARDQHGLYARARAGEIANVTGVDAPYEAPVQPDVRLDTVGRTHEQNVADLIAFLRERKLLRTP
jgi:adenylylsulfate kinase-like enzyme